MKLPFSYAVPPGATQPRLSQRIDTSDARPTQAVLARNPRRGGRLSLWTQQTVANRGVSAVRWYEIDPVGAPRLADNGLIAAPGVFLFDAAISPDRRVDGGTRAFGDSFVVGYNVSSAKAGIAPSGRDGVEPPGRAARLHAREGGRGPVPRLDLPGRGEALPLGRLQRGHARSAAGTGSRRRGVAHGAVQRARPRPAGRRQLDHLDTGPPGPEVQSPSLVTGEGAHYAG